MTRFHSFAHARRKSRRRLPRGIFEYIDRGIGEEASLRDLYARLDAITITPKVLGTKPARSTETELFGRTAGAPVAIAPTAMAGLVHPDGEVVLTRAATRHRVPVCLSTQSITSIERLRRMVPDAELWMQLYLWQDRDLSVGLLERAAGAGVEILVMTVDTRYRARKEWNEYNGFGMPFTLSPRNVADLCRHPGWIARVVLPNLLRDGLPAFGNYPEGMRPGLLGPAGDPRVELRHELTWEDVAWVRDRWRGKLVLKGILAPEDAEKARTCGADGIVVSSHGARNFDASPAPCDVLPQILPVSGGMTVMADSGIRRGLDVLRYRLLGAAAVMTGRLPLWALASGGEDGVDAAFEVLRQEYVEALDSAGIDEIEPGSLGIGGA